MADPRVSVVVATRDRPGRVAAMLDALRAATLAPGEFEVVVVDDGSAVRTRELLEAEVARGGLDLRIVRLDPAHGPGAARNAGWRVARGGLVAFTDDDCRPAPEWLAAGLAAHERAPEAVIQGRTEPDPAERHLIGPFSRTLRVEQLGPQYETCNMFYPRELLDALNGFDEGFGLRPGGEDTDLAWRAIELGRPTAFCEDALVYHAVLELGPLGALRDAARWTETIRVFSRHPQTRAILDHRIFWNGWHYLLAWSLLALLLPRPLRPLRWIILARHARALSGRARGDGASPWLAPFFFVYDLVQMISIARGAARHRTLVL